MANWGGAAQGAASGAATGTMIMPGWGTVIGGVVGGVIGLFSSDEEKEAADAYNKWLKDNYGPGGTNEKIIDQLIANGYNPFGPQITEEFGNTSQMTTSQTNERGREVMRKLADPAQRAGKKALENQVFGRLGQPAVTEGEMMRKLAQTNSVFDTLNRKQEVLGAGMGPVRRLGMEQGLDAQRGSMLLNDLAARPELERKRQFENEQAAQSLLRDWQGSSRDWNRQANTTTNMFEQFNNTRTAPPSVQNLQSLLIPPSQQSTAGGFSSQDAMNLIGAAGAAYGQWGNRPQSNPYNLQTTDYTNQVFSPGGR